MSVPSSRLTRTSRALPLLCAVAQTAAIAPAAADTPAPRVPDGFVIEKVTGDEVRFPMFAAFDERGRLFVAESSGLDLYAELSAQTRKCRVRVLEDRDGDGRFESAGVFAEGLVFPMGLVWHGGRLYVADPPELVALEDTNGDGRADRRTVILSGFGHRDNGSLHGLDFGPDGLLYMTMGAPDGYKLRREDGTTLTGKSGALIRARADGSRPEVLSRGFENLVEIAFLPTGEIIGTDNWYQRTKQGLRDALVHLVPDGLYPLHTRDKGTQFLETGDPLPALALFPAVAHSGIVRIRGTSYPPAMRGNLFAAEHNTRKVVRHRLVRHGSTFVSESEDFVVADDPDFHPSDVLEDADGSLLVVDTGSWYVHHCPTGRIRHSPATGGLFRVRHQAAAALADPRGLRLDWTVAARALAGRLEDNRPAVRDRAAAELARREGSVVAPLVALAGSPHASVQARQAAAWILAARSETAARRAVVGALRSPEPDLVATAARAAARVPDAHAIPALIGLLRHPRADVRLAAAEALGGAGAGARRTVLPALTAALAADVDPFLEHALVRACHRVSRPTDLRKALDHPSPRVQKMALALLDQAPHLSLGPADVLGRLGAADAGLRRTAQRLLARHAEWAPLALGAVGELIESRAPTDEQEAAIREVVPALSGRDEIVALVARAIEAGERGAPRRQRLVLLDVIAEGARVPLPEAWERALGAALIDPAQAVRDQAVRAIHALGVKRWDTELRRLAGDGTVPAAPRVEALRATIRRRPGLAAAELDLLLAQLGRDRAVLERLAAVEVLASSRLERPQAAALLARVRGDAAVAPAALLAAVLRAGIDPPVAAALHGFLVEGARLGWVLPAALTEEVRVALPEAQRPGFAGVLRDLARGIEQHRAQMVEYEPLLTGGSAARGEALYFGKAACGACHRVGPRGGFVGPDLTKIGAIRAGRDLLESLVAPSATFAQGYDAYSVVTKQDETLTGIRVRQDAHAITLRDASGAEVRVSSDQIKALEPSLLSVMPEGLLGVLSRDEARDLLAFVQSLR